MLLQSSFWMGRNDWHHARKADRIGEVGEFKQDYRRGLPAGGSGRQSGRGYGVGSVRGDGPSTPFLGFAAASYELDLDAAEQAGAAMTDLENAIRKALLWASSEFDEVGELLSKAARGMEFTGDKLYAPSSRPPEYVMAWLSPAQATLHVFAGTPVTSVEWQGRLPKGLLG